MVVKEILTILYFDAIKYGYYMLIILQHNLLTNSNLYTIPGLLYIIKFINYHYITRMLKNAMIFKLL